MSEVSTASQPDRPKRRMRLTNRLRRRISRASAIALALVLVGGAYSAWAAPHSEEGAQEDAPIDVRAGEVLYNNTCISCHGDNLDGVEGRGPSLLGVGEASVYFQVSTGRMPLARQEAQAPEKQERFTDEQVRQLAAYVQSIAGGPQLPRELHISDADIAEGGELFRLNCASCHNFAGRGGALSEGGSAPSIDATPDEIYAAMLSGPQNMPVFGDNQITPEQKEAIIAYLETLRTEKDPGGNSLGRLGPVPEGLVIWIVGIGLLMIAVLWIGNRA